MLSHKRGAARLTGLRRGHLGDVRGLVLALARAEPLFSPGDGLTALGARLPKLGNFKDALKSLQQRGESTLSQAVPNVVVQIREA